MYGILKLNKLFSERAQAPDTAPVRARSGFGVAGETRRSDSGQAS